MIEVKAPGDYSMHRNFPSLFLAGSIDMGTAEKWQDRIVDLLKDKPVLILNPRRDNWDNSLKQDISDPQFSEQVNWELDALNEADQILFYFDPNSKSPITLLELGLMAYRENRILVICPEGYWRRGNVQIVCDRHRIVMMNSIDEFIDKLKSKL